MHTTAFDYEKYFSIHSTNRITEIDEMYTSI